MNPKFKLLAIAAALSLGTLLSPSAMAAGLDLGNAAGYGIVSAGAGSSLKINSGPINGNLLVGAGTTVSTSGGGNGQIVGSIYDDGTVAQSAFGGLQVSPTAGQFVAVSSAFIAGAVQSAADVSTYADSLSANQTFTNISSATTFNGNGGVYVIDVNNISNADLTFSGSASDFFVVNVAGTYQTNKTITLSGVTSDHVLFNFLGTSGNVFQTSGGDLSYGTYLATRGGNFQFSNLVLASGSLINTAGHIEFVSGSKMTAAPITPVPEPSTYAMMLAGLGLLGLFGRRLRKED